MNMLKIGASITAFIIVLCFDYVDWVAARANRLDVPTLAQLKDFRTILKAAPSSRRLRVVAFTHNDLTPGELVDSKEIDWRLACVSESNGFVTEPRHLVGVFSTTTIQASVPIRQKDVSRNIPGVDMPGHLNVPIPFDAQTAAKLKPGMRLALVNSNSFLLLETALTNGASFYVLSILHDGTEPTASVLLSIPADQTNILSSLVSRQWRPIIMPTHP